MRAPIDMADEQREEEARDHDTQRCVEANARSTELGVI